MYSRASRGRQIGARSLVAMVLLVVLIGCDSNPGGPVAPSRSSVAEATSPEAPTSVADSKKTTKRKAKRLSQHGGQTATFE
jgi:hypothetical protein